MDGLLGQYDLPAGTEVLVNGLIKAAELNGKVGTVVRRLDKVSAVARFVVDLNHIGPQVHQAHQPRSTRHAWGITTSFLLDAHVGSPCR